jgi:hypothetical protein
VLEIEEVVSLNFKICGCGLFVGVYVSPLLSVSAWTGQDGCYYNGSEGSMINVTVLRGAEAPSERPHESHPERETPMVPSVI